MKAKSSIFKYAYRSKKNGHFFIFVQYYEDGYGKYEDRLSEQEVLNGNLPALFFEKEQPALEFAHHTKDEVERVKLKLDIKVEAL